MKSFKTNEKSVRLIEAENTLVIEVDRRDKKDKIKIEAEQELGIKIKKVNTYIKDNKKYAYLKQSYYAELRSSYGASSHLIFRAVIILLPSFRIVRLKLPKLASSSQSLCSFSVYAWPSS